MFTRIQPAVNKHPANSNALHKVPVIVWQSAAGAAVRGGKLRYGTAGYKKTFLVEAESTAYGDLESKAFLRFLAAVSS